MNERDLIDDLIWFTKRYPAWCGPDGLPLSFDHYRYGMAAGGRLQYRDDIRLHDVMSMAHTHDKAAHTKWISAQKALGGIKQ